MACNRCTDIHEAQKSGKTQESCKCSCHNTNTGGFWYNVNDTTATTPNMTWTTYIGNDCVSCSDKEANNGTTKGSSG